MNKHLKVLIIALCSIALVVGSVAVTMAYLVDTTVTKNDTFTVGNIDIELNAAGDISHKMMPGDEIDPNREVTVIGGSEKCYLFIEMSRENNFDTYLTYTMAADWVKLNDDGNVYYRVVDTNANNQTFDVFTNFIARPECTKAQYDAIAADKKPNIKLTAYAVQHKNIETAAEAWNVVKPPVQP